MEFESPLTEGILLKRYKRFLADIALSKTERRTIYCPNNGALHGCDILGSRLWFSTSDNSRRRYPDTWELVEVDGGHLVVVNLKRSFALFQESIEKGTLAEFKNYKVNNHETDSVFSQAHADFILINETSSQTAHVMLQSVTMGDEIHRGFYPDAIHLEASKQVEELVRLKANGHRAILFFCVMHTGINRVFPADHIDAHYGQLLREAVKNEVEIYAYRANITFKKIQLDQAVEVCIPTRKYGSQILSR